jgi:predicted ribosome quality control (RQC) complex YloA/Tae2 family protein
VIERAAQLAAWYSKARAARRVEVHLCAVGDVTKPRGAKPSSVQLRKFEKVFVTPVPVDSDSDESASPSGDASGRPSS